ncbi:MAG: double-strand break repair protein AddB [Rhodospirillales bacterium]|nr:double-strand break repair protein AddB [Rhodospirillales bacterium]
MNLFTLPSDAPVLDAVAAAWLAQAGRSAAGDDDPLAPARGLILLPTRRAARALAEAFLRASGGRALLLPRITALGALDEAPLTLAGALDLPPAVETSLRLAALTRLILGLNGAYGAPATADRAWALAGELALLMDEAERAEVDLATRLPDAADPAFAAHWSLTVEFLHIVTAAWPRWLAEQGFANPAARMVALLDAQAAAWERTPPAEPVWLVGTTGGIPAVGRLARVLAAASQGAVLLPGLDRDLPAAAWDALGPAHPQAGVRRLLDRLGARREDVRDWPRPGRGGAAAGAVPPGRVTLLRRALLPGTALADWRPEAADAAGDVPEMLAGLSRLEPADPREEAAAIALILRGAIATAGARAALVTPDRALAGRVAAELLRYGVIADDSAGEPLAETPPAVLLRLLARALAEELAPVPLLALLKHPLAAAGLAPAACRAATRALEIAILRGPRPAPGLSGLRRAIDRLPADSQPANRAFLERVEACLSPALRVGSGVAAAPAEALDALIAAAERLAAATDADGPSRLWAGEEGTALAEHLAALREALPLLPDQRRAVFPALLDAILAGPVIRSRRALRGREGTEHPRVFIWGLLEARLQQVETLVLGGLAEGVWPPAVDPGPWLSRPMRERIGLPAPEEAVGQSAHDFVSAACAAPEVVLSCARRRDGAPSVPARWLARLDAFLAGRNAALPAHPALAWTRALDQPAAAPVAAAPPFPRPPPARRPRRLSVTEIETWLRDPYAIYARHVLRLRPLDPLEQETDAADYGTLVHRGLHMFLEEQGPKWPPGAAARLRHHLLAALQRAGLRPALANWWAPRLERIADWVAEIERDRRARAPLAAIWPELPGRWVLERPGGRFELRGRADRIERRTDGRLAILDYKTGRPPSAREVAAGLAPQLLLEAAMAQSGGFGPERVGEAAELAYWHVTGGYEPGAELALCDGRPAELAAAVAAAAAGLAALIDRFDHPGQAYLSQPHPGRAPRFSDYAQLARVAERSVAGEGE